MISVIVPIYNVEPYLRKCLDSVIEQTYKDLEILLIDDGSTDRCGKIGDEYEKQDNRITVFHTENRGLSAARNLGIANANGEYLYFIDSDDWIDEDLLEKAIKKIGDADILCFSKYEGKYTGLEALCALVNEKISTSTWNKLYRATCFSTIRFPEGRIIEDIATTYKLLHKSEIVVSRNISGYHHIYRKDSIIQTHDLKNIFDYYLAVKEQYDYCISVFSLYFSDPQCNLTYEQKEELRINLLKYRAYAIARAWGWRNDNEYSDSPQWEILANEARTLFPYNVRKHFPIRIRGGVFLARFNHPLSFWLAHIIHIQTRKKYLYRNRWYFNDL